MLKLLCITAHPDDEVGSFAGTLIKYGRERVETYVICLTAGTAAKHRGGAKSDDELAAMRRREFADACKLLRVSDGEVLDFPDGKLDRVPTHVVAEVLVKRIRELRPQVIATIGTEGGATAHPDHAMAGLFATAAFHWAGRTNRYVDQLQSGQKPHRAQKLYYTTNEFSLPGREQISPAPATTIIHTPDSLDLKIEAFAAHTSQNPLLPLFENYVRDHGSNERFHLAAAITPRNCTMETDLFEGVTEN